MLNVLKSKLKDIREITRSDDVRCAECKQLINEENKEVWFLDDDAVSQEERYCSGIVCVEQVGEETRNAISESFGYAKAFCCYGCLIGHLICLIDKVKKQRKLSNLAKL